MLHVFDFGGVLFRWQPPQLLRRELPHHSLDETRAQALARRIFQGPEGDWAEFDRGRIERDDLAARLAARTGLSVEDMLCVIDGVPRELQPIPATLDLLARLREAGAALAYLSNMPAPVADHLEREHDFVAWFGHGVFSSRVHLAKPDPRVFAVAAERFGRPAHELVLLDDHLPNVDAARAAGWQALHFIGAAQAQAQLRERGWWPA